MPAEALVHLRRRLDTLPPRHPDRAEILRSARELCGVSRATLYRALQQHLRPKAVRRADRGKPRKISTAEMERYCEIVAALKLRTTNKKGRHLSTVQAIRLMEEHGVEAPEGLVQPVSGTLHKSTVNRYLSAWGLDYARVTRAPAAVRFQARRSNELWQFDMSPSDLKHVKQPLWIEPGRGAPTLMLFSVVDDRSGVVYQEYRCVYGEDAEAALRFLYNAMAAKPEEDMPFQGIPEAIYMDNGPVTRSRVFQNVMACLGIKVMTHLPAGSDGRRTTARSKGKVERPFRTVKDVHETLYHFHEPQDEAEANLWLRRYLVRYNAQDHRSEPHSRIEDWVRNLPEKGFRDMCAWDRFCTFAREPERRKVGIDTRIAVEGVAYEVDPDLAGEDVVLWWGLFDQELYVEHGDRRYGPYGPVGGPIPLHKYRKHQKSKSEERADRVAELAERIGLPRAALDGGTSPLPPPATAPAAKEAFNDPDPYRTLTFPDIIAAKRAIAGEIGLALAKLSAEDRAWIDALVRETLAKDEVLTKVRAYFRQRTGGGGRC
ncbi:DDE-type integrase/transposase/recombinase [Azospirillum sp. B510]|uniref:DDE-type integrase/transposase/recombinase n=1 Tax=Azospirillum sp. (strain B510) TaxID=137722 RepID=UPI000B34A39A|nr:DDE-type integrase/transposase/recombinase [Azospirillum sp. B510]